MPPKKGKTTPKSKAQKEPQVEAEANGVTETVEETTAPVEETNAGETSAKETAAKEPQVEDASIYDAPASEEPAAEADVAAKETKSNKRKEAADTPTKQTAAVSKKRKADLPLPREGERKSGRGAQKSQPSTEQLLNYLLSQDAAELCRPDDESDELKKQTDLKTYSSSALSPFEELVCAVVLSRPISHKLGLRAIRTILNDPYSFNTPKAIINAGKEKRHQALIDARSQHKEKTADQIGLVADVVAHKFAKDDSDTTLDRLRDQASKGWDMERDLLQENIKGVGKTGLDIFFRRVQWLWPEAFPYVDERSSRGIEKLNLPKNPDELARTLDRYWAKLDTSNLEKGDKETKKRRAFVVICERATSADLEGKSEAILEAAASF
jgi:hypothetical protein